MKISELSIGDWVQSKTTKSPMQVVGIFAPSTLYLNFDGNEGDVFEEEIDDVEGVPILEAVDAIQATRPDVPILVRKDSIFESIRGIEIETIEGVFHSVHEYQHALRLAGFSYMADNFKI